MWSDGAKLAVLREHLTNDNFNYFTDKTLRYWPEGRQGHSVKLLREGREMREEMYKKNIIFDCDGVVNKPATPAPMEFYVDYITDKNDYLMQRKEHIIRNIKMLEKEENFGTYADAISDDFRKGGLSWRTHVEACNYSRENLSLATNFTPTMSRLRDMGYRPFVLSASPRDLVVRLSKRLAIVEDDIEATEFHFDQDGLFQNMQLNLGSTRAEKRDRIMERTVLTKYGLEVMVNDNPVTGRKIVKSGWNHVYFWLKDSPPMPENINVDMLDLRRDFERLVGKIKQLERGLAVTIMMDEKGYKEAIGIAHDVMEMGNRAMNISGLEFNEDKKKFARMLRSYVKRMGGIFPSKQTEIFLHLRDVETDRNERTAKPKLRAFLEKFFASSLEAKLPQNLYS